MQFLNPTMLLGILGIGVPIIVHLVCRQETSRLKWAATRFLKAGVEQNRRRHRLENALLLVLRSLVVALVALALARPAIISSNQPAPGNPAVADEPPRSNLSLRAEVQLRVLLVDGDVSGQDPRGSTFFLLHALQPVSASERDRYFIKTTTVTPAELPSVTLNDFNAIMLADVSEFSDSTAIALQQYARHGGALVIFPGPHINRSFYNEQLFRHLALLPVELGEPHSDKFLKVQPPPYNHPITSLWNDSGAGDLTSARFYCVFPLESRAGERQDPPEVVLRFEDGSPAMMTGRLGNGHVILFASTADTEWNDLPTRPVFVPLIHRILAAVFLHSPASQTNPIGHHTNTSKELAVPFAAAVFLVALAETILARTFSRSARVDLSRQRRGWLLFLRLLAFACMLLLLLQPSFMRTWTQRVTPRLVLLIDTSASMTVREAGKTRIDRVKSLLKDLLPGLAADYIVEPYVFGQHVSELSRDRGDHWIDHIAATSSVTAIGDSVEKLLNRERDQPATGIILFTDGRNNSGASLREAAAVAHQRNVPLYICGIGSISPPDVIIADVSAPELAFVQDDVPVSVRLHSKGMDGRSATLTLKVGDETADHAVVTFASNGENTATLMFHAKAAGSFVLRASIEPFPDEATDKNNQRSKQIYVTDRKVKVLLVDGSPRWSFQSWQSVLAGDPRVELNCLLLDGESDIVTDEHPVFLSQFPAQLFAYDLIVFGDVNPKELTGGQLDSMTRFVSVLGGGFVMIAGQHYSPRAYQRTALEKLLPIEADSGEADPSAAIERIAFTEEARSGSLMRVPDSMLADTSALAPLQWLAPSKVIKPGAKVLATASNAPQMVVQQYGRGRTLFIASDELWRWTKDLGEHGYAAFLEQIVQSLSLPRLLPGAQAFSTDSTLTREFEDVSMDEPSLREMARISGGEFFHENELDEVVRVLHAHPGEGRFSRKIAFWSAPLYFILLMSILTTEWTLRRLSQLK